MFSCKGEINRFC